ncbi:MAG TPA: phosphoribosylglycinamide formyltransferase [Pseudomonadales bacterium]|jgi:phosphoribosylglycinamide formyltransferase-1
MTGKRLVILLSGSGSNLQAFIDACACGKLPARIVGVISNKPDAAGLQRAADAGIATTAIDHRPFDSRDSFDAALMQAIDSHRPDLVILAGFMRILTPGFVRHYAGRLMNIHPSLLPKYPGLNTHARAIDAGDREAGATVHFVTEELDGGPAIVQARVAVLAHDTPETLAQRVLSKEHMIYPLAARWFAEDRLTLDNNKVILDGHVLPESGFAFTD